MLATLRRLASVAPLGARGVAFTATKSSSQARGLKKDPEEYMVSPHGTRYPGNSGHLENARQFLGEFSLSDNLLLQCLVHKSFAHGKVPYNEKLAILGQQLFRFQAFRAAAEIPGTAPLEAKINDKNFNIDENAVEILSSTPVVATVCEKAGLEQAMFYKPANEQTGPRVKAKVIHALVGALILEKGAPEAIRFINTRLLSGNYSVFNIAERFLVHN